MLESPHVALGVAIAIKVQNPLIAIPTSLASHFILDVLPHWNPHINREIKKYGKPTKQSVTIIVADSLLAFMIGLFAAYSKSNDAGIALTILACSLASVIPDIVEAPYYFLGYKTTIIEKWIAWQKGIQNDADIIPGIASQIAVIVASFWWIWAK